MSRHVYKIYYDPQTEIEKIIDDFDKSQMSLLVLTALIPLFVYLVLRIIWDLVMYGNIAAVFGDGLNFVLLVEALIFGYLGYFLVKVLNKK